MLIPFIKKKRKKNSVFYRLDCYLRFTNCKVLCIIYIKISKKTLYRMKILNDYPKYAKSHY